MDKGMSFASLKERVTRVPGEPITTARSGMKTALWLMAVVDNRIARLKKLIAIPSQS